MFEPILPRLTAPSRTKCEAGDGRAHDKSLHLPGRAELPLCPGLSGGAAAPPYQGVKIFGLHPTRESGLTPRLALCQHRAMLGETQMFGKCVCLGCVWRGRRHSHNRAPGWTWAACRPAPRCRSSAPREASGDWKSRGRRLLSCNSPNRRKWRSFARKRTFASLVAGYKIVKKSGTTINAQAEIAGGDNVVFRVQDRWSLSGACFR